MSRGAFHEYRCDECGTRRMYNATRRKLADPREWEPVPRIEAFCGACTRWTRWTHGDAAQASPKLAEVQAVFREVLPHEQNATREIDAARARTEARRAVHRVYGAQAAPFSDRLNKATSVMAIARVAIDVDEAQQRLT